jgi:hypothetical protein
MGGSPVISAVGIELGVEAFSLEAFEEFGICAFLMSIAPRISDGGKADFGANGDAILPEEATGELAVVVGDDAVGHYKAANRPLDEPDS